MFFVMNQPICVASLIYRSLLVELFLTLCSEIYVYLSFAQISYFSLEIALLNIVASNFMKKIAMKPQIWKKENLIT